MLQFQLTHTKITIFHSGTLEPEHVWYHGIMVSWYHGMVITVALQVVIELINVVFDKGI